jgi:hypothetical protein
MSDGGSLSRRIGEAWEVASRGATGGESGWEESDEWDSPSPRLLRAIGSDEWDL